MEHALFLPTRAIPDPLPDGYDRLYCGIEFCERLLPRPARVLELAAAAQASGLAFTLVTPFLTDAGLPAAEALVDALALRGLAFEVVINDWGLLHRLSGRSLHLALGRLLCRQKRGPRILDLVLPPTAFRHFRMAGADAPHQRALLDALGVGRIELDNLLQGIARPPGALPASLYYPFCYVTTTRLCRSLYGEKRSTGYRSIGPCGEVCRNHLFALRHRTMPRPLLLRGNTQFVEHRELPEELEALGIDRLVHQPEPPI